MSLSTSFKHIGVLMVHWVAVWSIGYAGYASESEAFTCVCHPHHHSWFCSERFGCLMRVWSFLFFLRCFPCSTLQEYQCLLLSNSWFLFVAEGETVKQCSLFSPREISPFESSQCYSFIFGCRGYLCWKKWESGSIPIRTAMTAHFEMTQERVSCSMTWPGESFRHVCSVQQSCL